MTEVHFILVESDTDMWKSTTLLECRADLDSRCVWIVSCDTVQVSGRTLSALSSGHYICTHVFRNCLSRLLPNWAYSSIFKQLATNVIYGMVLYWETKPAWSPLHWSGPHLLETDFIDHNNRTSLYKFDILLTRVTGSITSASDLNMKSTYIHGYFDPDFSDNENR